MFVWGFKALPKTPIRWVCLATGLAIASLAAFLDGLAHWAGAVAYLGNAQSVIWIYHRWALSAFCWLPWLFWALYRGQFAKKIQLAPALFLALAICNTLLIQVLLTDWWQPLLNLLSYPAMILPWIFGRLASLDLWKIWQSSLINLGWFGFLPTLLAFLAIFWKKTPLSARLLMIAGWLIPLIPLVGPLYRRVVLLSI